MNVYRKPNHTDQCLAYDSHHPQSAKFSVVDRHHPQSAKFSVVDRLLKRVEGIVTDKNKKEEEICQYVVLQLWPVQ